MKIKTSELSGVALDWAVAQVAGVEVAMRYGRELAMVHDRGGIKLIESIRSIYSPSTNWSQGGPLIERFGIRLHRSRNGYSWYAGRMLESKGWNDRYEDYDSEVDGQPTGSPLIAACRAIVAAKLGDEVDVPEGLV